MEDGANMEAEGRIKLEEGSRGLDVHDAAYLAWSTNIHMYNSTGHICFPAIEI
jgi:hypothetical protein